jgi:predicted nucleotidyltransferase
MTIEARGATGMNVTRQWAIDELRRMVLDILGEHDAAVWLFGSCARGDARHYSDIDVAIMPWENLPHGFFAELEDAIEESTIPYDVDLVDLREANPALIAQIRAEGVPWRN